MALLHCVAVMVVRALGRRVMVLVAAVPADREAVVGVTAVSGDVVRVGIEHAADLAEAVIGEEEEEPVFDDGAADRAAELLLLVDGLSEQEGRGSRCGGPGYLLYGSSALSVGVAQGVEEVAVDLVGAALGDGVDLAAGGLAELDGVVGGLGLELLDGVDGVDIGRAGSAATGLGEEHLVVVGAVDVVLVVEAADAVEADEAGAAVLDDVGGVQNEGAPVAGGDGQIGDERLRRGSARLRSSRCRGWGTRW